VQGGSEGVRNGIEVFVAKGRKVSQVDAAIGGFRRALAAINRNVMTARGEPGRQFLGERFKPAVIGGYAARA
jgi:hypothetical protein